MKRAFVAVACCVFICLAAIVSGQLDSSCAVSLSLIEGDASKAVSGLIRIYDGEGKSILVQSVKGNVASDSLLPRSIGLENSKGIDRWFVVSGQVKLTLPRQKLTFEAFSGLDTELAKVVVDLSDRREADVSIPLTRFYDASKQSMKSANTHLHLMKLTREQSDRYLKEIPRADRLDVLFVSYLERAEADRDYISNRYTRADLEQLEQASGTVFGNGEEHRHNLDSHTEGFGHVMLLDLQKLIQPVSIGPGITKTGTDGTPLQRGIDQAHRDGATIIWCHNEWGFERVANLVTGRLDAQNIFDGSIRSSYKDSFYRCLNAGMKVPFSTGTDWFMYDFSRTYVKVDGPLTVKSWLKSLAAGRSFITNGPFLEFRVNGNEPGDVIKLNGTRTVTVEARGIGRIDFQRIEIIQNGNVVRSQVCKQEGGHFVADLKFELSLSKPCWLALRIPPPPVQSDPELRDLVPLNEYGQSLFAHTSVIGVEIEGKKHFDRDVANGLLSELRANVRTIDQKATFADATEKARVNDVYQDAIVEFERRLAPVDTK
jgi:hypothetical protein